MNILYYGIAFPVLKVLTKIVYDLKIEGKENVRNIKTGAVTVSNHVLYLDCAMIGLACGRKNIFYTTREESFEIPFVRILIKYLRAIKIPKDFQEKIKFRQTIDNLLQTGNLVQIYPEGVLETYCKNLRSFRNGAFHFAINNNVPIIPIVIKFREPKGIRKIFKRKKDVTLVVLEPIEVERTNNIKEDVINLKRKVYEEMEKNLLNIKD